LAFSKRRKEHFAFLDLNVLQNSCQNNATKSIWRKYSFSLGFHHISIYVLVSTHPRKVQFFAQRKHEQTYDAFKYLILLEKA
jgi:hypothetical protein